MDCTLYDNQMQDIVDRSDALRFSLVEPFRRDDGSLFIPVSCREQQERNAVLEKSIKGTIFEEIGRGGSQVAAAWADALAEYERKYGRHPSPEVLAAAHRAAENVVKMRTGAVTAPSGFEGMEMNTSDGIIMMDRLISLILPVYLTMITSSMVTYIPANFDQSEFVRIKRVAGSTFSDLKKGDAIGYNYNGLYFDMKQQAELATGDGSTTSFAFDSKTKYCTVYPFKPRRTVIEIAGIKVGRDDGKGNIAGTHTVNGVAYNVTGMVSYSDGNLNVTIFPAPASGVKVTLFFDVDIEKAPELLPRTESFMERCTMYPHVGTVIAPPAYRHMFRQDVPHQYLMAMQNLCNDIAAEKDKKHLHDMYDHVGQTVEWKRTGAEGFFLRGNYESLQQKLYTVDDMLKKGTGTAGLTGLVAGIRAVNLLRHLPAPFFVPSPGYCFLPRPHYVGRLCGSFDLYCDPLADDEWGCLCYARGQEYGQTAYVAGDAVPAQIFRVRKDLGSSLKLWELAYRDMQDFDGNKYLVKLNFVEA